MARPHKIVRGQAGWNWVKGEVCRFQFSPKCKFQICDSSVCWVELWSHPADSPRVVAAQGRRRPDSRRNCRAELRRFGLKGVTEIAVPGHLRISDDQCIYYVR